MKCGTDIQRQPVHLPVDTQVHLICMDSQTPIEKPRLNMGRIRKDKKGTPTPLQDSLSGGQKCGRAETTRRLTSVTGSQQA